MRRLLILGVAFALFGCATEPAPDHLVKILPASKYTTIPVSTTDSAVITVIRDDGFTRAENSVYVIVDGVDIAAVNVRERIDFSVEPGDRQICGRAGPPSMGKPLCLEMLIKPRASHLIRVGFDAGGLLSLHREIHLAQ